MRRHREGSKETSPETLRKIIHASIPPNLFTQIPFGKTPGYCRTGSARSPPIAGPAMSPNVQAADVNVIPFAWLLLSETSAIAALHDPIIPNRGVCNSVLVHCLHFRITIACSGEHSERYCPY